MSKRRTLSALLLVCGVGIFGFGSYLSYQAMQSEGSISQVEEKLQEYNRRPMGPIRRRIRAEREETAQQKIGQAEQRVTQSRVTADWLRGVGIVLFILGVGGLVFFRKKKR